MVYRNIRAGILAGTAIPDPVAVLDFTTGTYMVNGSPITISQLLADANGTGPFVRASVKTDLMPDSPAGFAYTTFANDVPSVTARGILIEEARTQLVVNPTTPATQDITIASTGTRTLWVNGTGSATVTANTAVITGGGTATTGNPITFNVTTIGTVTITVTGSLQAMQVETGTAGTSFIPFTGARVIDNVNLQDPLNSVLRQDAAAYVASFETTPATGTFKTIVSQRSQSLANASGSSQVFGNNTQGGNAITATCGFGTVQDCTAGLTYGGSTRSIAANGGALANGTTMVIGAAPLDTPARIRIGGTQMLNGFIRKLTIWDKKIDPNYMREFTLNGQTFSAIAYGDSLTARADGISSTTSYLSYPQYLGGMLTPVNNVFNAGRDGLNSTQISAAQASLPFYNGLPTIIWSGRNNYASKATVLADVATMVSRLTTPYYIVMSVLNGEFVNEGAGESNFLLIQDLNNDLAATYGANFLDIRQLLVDSYDSGNPADVKDFSEDRPPFSRRLQFGNRTLVGAIDASQTTLTLSASLSTLANEIIKIDDEYIKVLGGQGTSTVTSCIRGWAGTAAAHSNGATVNRRDPLHLDPNGREFVAQSVRAKMLSLGWPI